MLKFKRKFRRQRVKHQGSCCAENMALVEISIGNTSRDSGPDSLMMMMMMMLKHASFVSTQCLLHRCIHHSWSPYERTYNILIWPFLLRYSSLVPHPLFSAISYLISCKSIVQEKVTLLGIFLKPKWKFVGQQTIQNKKYTGSVRLVCIIPAWQHESLRVIIQAITANCPSDPRDEEHGELMVR